MEDSVNSDNDNIDVLGFIKERLDFFDKSNEKFYHLIKSAPENVTQNETELTILFKDKNVDIYQGKATILGTFDLNTRIWVWAWVTPYYTLNQTKHSRDILNYGLNLEPDTNTGMHFYLKNHFISSRIYFETDIALDIHLALALYIAKTKFIYSKSDKQLKTITYFLVY